MLFIVVMFITNIVPEGAETVAYSVETPEMTTGKIEIFPL